MFIQNWTLNRRLATVPPDDGARLSRRCLKLNTTSARKTRAKPIQVAINKWCGKKKCVVRRTKLETYVAWRTQTVCCSGWQYNENDSCAPLCSTGCNGGRCTAPDTCTCDPPAVTHPEHKYTCIRPQCNPPCVNGQCINDTCVCQDNYEKLNGTHCYHCEPGLTLAANFTCVKCQCDNGSCVDNTCVCDTGYVLKDNLCEPICESCNGRCIRPNVCQCNNGYTYVNGKCEPICNNCNGICVRANVCQCFDGYINVGGKCEPLCSCDKCLAPNVCNCSEGYRSANGTCVPICIECVNGYCSAPDVCSCNEGFMKNSDGVCQACSEVCTCNANGECLEEICRLYGRRRIAGCCIGYIYDSSSNSCSAKCDNCNNGTCVTPNNCVCTPPLVLINGNTCVNPICDQPCTHGQCTSRNVCTCETGYAPVDQFTCKPVCDPACENGKCEAPNICTCSVGYTLVNKTCQPVCNECDNGECIAPNDCKCNTGYTKQNSICVPDCQRPCVNGICSEPDKCSCNVGFAIDPLDRFNCQPVCETPCVNATCISPGTCCCFSGYLPLNDTICTPKCDNCVHGDCIGPNECRCHKGYVSESGKCMPKCDDCSNGQCTAPNTCVCDGGYSLSNGTCKPVCNPECVNAMCVGPNQCRCFEGFRSSNSSTCERHCDNCENGKCLEGNYCFCNEGYSLVKGVCTPSCSLSCVNARCAAPNTCECLEGYKRNQTSPNNCFKACVCSNGRCIEDQCICDAGYEMLDGNCTEIRPVECKTCEGECSDGICWCKDGKPCYHLEEPAEVGAPTKLAGLELGWLLGGVVGLALLTLVIIVMGHIWRKRREYGVKETETGGNEIGSVVYTVPDTLLTRRPGSVVNVYGENEDENESVNEPLRPTDDAL
ncbi:tenascin-like isoform X1 [Pieris brassicae]|uniref:tenascin-like isoform X1 n=1 Tax=Pieris brassicae TaxID=7116 RepID=UPI001E65E37A|nr:tenascin-like isoform X1 [Pieris brassicae]